MPRLPRRAIPVEVKCRVAMRQLGEMWPEAVLAAHERKLGELLDRLKTRLAELLGCGVDDLRLDHDPALGAREKIRNANGTIIEYVPDEHDPAHLIYRTQAAHHIKTNVRGDGAQFPDRVLIKRARKFENGKSVSKKRHPLAAKGPKRRPKPGKRAWPSRPLRSANRWPPRGSRPILGRRPVEG